MKCTSEVIDLLENYKHLLDNWEGLVSYAKVKLSLTEKLKLGNFFSYAKAMKDASYYSHERDSYRMPR